MYMILKAVKTEEKFKLLCIKNTIKKELITFFAKNYTPSIKSILYLISIIKNYQRFKSPGTLHVPQLIFLKKVALMMTVAHPAKGNGFICRAF